MNDQQKKQPKVPKKPGDSIRIKASEFDDLMRRALGVPPEVKEKAKAKKKK